MKSPLGPEKGSAVEEHWEPCSPGVLLHATSAPLTRRRILKLIAGGTVLTAVTGGIAIGSQSRTGSNQPTDNSPCGGIACNSVLDHLPNYLNGKLDEQINERITTHLIECPCCRREYTQLCCNSAPGCVSRPRKPKFKTTPCSLR